MPETHDSHLTVPYYVNPASWSLLKNTVDAAAGPSTSSCLDCVNQSYPSSEITSQCTDKCVVVACNDPDHGEISCYEAQDNSHCDLVCDRTTQCNNCTGFDQFLQCCTDYHSYIAEPRIASPQSAPVPWDSSFESFLCACTEQGEGPAARMDSFASTGVENNFMPATNHVSQNTSSSLYVGDQTLELACMWGNCHAQFTSLSDLVGHVNLEHLRLPPAPAPRSPSAVSSDSSPLSCLWRDCTVYSTPESMSASSSSDPAEGLLDVLANHLLQDHLGHYLPATDSENDPLAFLDAQTNLDRQHLNNPNLVSEFERGTLSPPLSHQCSGNHKCNWISCGRSFTTCSDLTSHITAVHVGCGKAHYECFWEGCNRNGGNGFSSKQKISRHLQSHTGHRPFQCEVCLQNFSEAATLQQHMRRHTQEKPYKCDYPECGKSFAITGALTIHKRMHNGHKPFKCKFCDKAFAESSNLSKHLRTHTGARPYSCVEPGCNKSFARPDQLSRHAGVHRKGSSVEERMNS